MTDMKGSGDVVGNMMLLQCSIVLYEVEVLCCSTMQEYVVISSTILYILMSVVWS